MYRHLSNRLYYYLSLGVLTALLAMGCQPGGTDDNSAAVTSADALFQALPAAQSGIEFTNELVIDKNFDVFRYRNYYNGGGVGIGDVNNDGLPDLYLVANSGPNQLYLNRGDLRFEEVTATAGVAGQKPWSTGVAMVDINADGWLDIYVCNSGDVKGGDKGNELFINQRNGTFTEEAARYGLADEGFSTHSVFFDYDRDGDLDCYVLNNSFRPISTLNLRNLRNQRDPLGGDKLYRNDKGKFKDVSEQAGIYGSVIGFGLGVTVGDVNLDGWQDIYVSNDFYERDYLYLNGQNGTFQEVLPYTMGHTSNFSMGADMADLTNDGYPEIFVTDMLGESLQRVKQTTAFLSYDEEQLRLSRDFHYQYMRNTLQLNNGDGTFSEIAQATGTEATDWSWGALIADLDNNGHKDIFVSNGVYKDVTDQDFVKFLANDQNIRAAQQGQEIDFQKFIDLMPTTPVHNYAFANDGNLQFRNASVAWGFGQPTTSNGAAYGDLDNDGDLDLVINNVNEPLLLYRNRTDEQYDHHYLRFQFRGGAQNSFAVGSSVAVYRGTDMLYYEHMPMRGFESSMDYTAVLGLGADPAFDSIIIYDPYGRQMTMPGSSRADTTYIIATDDARFRPVRRVVNNAAMAAQFTEEPQLFGGALPLHRENEFVDFDRDRLLYHGVSREGPKLARGDLNGDGADDFYLCGAHRRAGELWLSTRGGQQFASASVAALVADSLYEDTDAKFIDVDGDQDLDLLVVSGGNELIAQSEYLQDRLYRNESQGGKIIFRRDDSFPRLRRVSSCVVPLDYDGDGDSDLFIGTRLDPKGYGIPTSSYLLENDGQGNFTDVSAARARDLRNVGMVTAAGAADLDGNGTTDLLLAGDWMPLTILSNDQGQFTAQALPNTAGLWRSLLLADVDGDGRTDIVAGNLGLNSRFKGTPERPLELFTKDFDNNGSLEQIVAKTEADGKLYPMALRHDLAKVLPQINKRFNSYTDYMDKTVSEVFESEQLVAAEHLTATELRTSLYLNRADGWQRGVLPIAAQFAPIYAIVQADIDTDGQADLLLGGNYSQTVPEIGRYDATFGVLLRQTAPGQFVYLPARQSGLRIGGEIRDLLWLPRPGLDPLLLVARNNQAMQAIRVSKRS